MPLGKFTFHVKIWIQLKIYPWYPQGTPSIIFDLGGGECGFYTTAAILPCSSFRNWICFQPVLYDRLMIWHLLSAALFRPVFDGHSNSTLTLTLICPALFFFRLLCVPCTVNNSPSNRTRLPVFKLLRPRRIVMRPLLIFFPRYWCRFLWSFLWFRLILPFVSSFPFFVVPSRESRYSAS